MSGNSNSGARKLKAENIQPILDARQEREILKEEVDLYMASGYTRKDPEVASRLKQIKGLSLKALGEKYGVSYHTIWNVTSGRTWKSVGVTS